MPSPRRQASGGGLAIIEGVRERLKRRERADLAGQGREAGLSAYHLQRLFAAAYGESPKAFSDRVRAERADEMLRQGAKPIEVVVSLRYTEPSAFSRDFKRHHGLSPRAFCNNCQPLVSSKRQE